MRIRIAKITFLVVFINILALYYSWKLISKYRYSAAVTNATFTKPTAKSYSRHISKSVTVILRSFDFEENDITLTVESVFSVFPNIQILILSDGLPYPPLDVVFANTTRNIKVVDLSLNLRVPYRERYPLFNVKTKYVLFVPDSTRINSRHVIASMISEINRSADRIVAVPVGGFDNHCLNINLNIKQWTIKYSYIKNNNTCDAVQGKHVVLVETQLLRKLTDVFMLPFPEALYLQTSAVNVKVKVLKDHILHEGKPLFRSHHSQKKYQLIEQVRLKEMYQKFSIKKVIKPNGNVEWYGCTRDTQRCFGTVVESMPSYLYAGKWTPPCCLSNLRTVARHVFQRLDESGVRYWLEGGSLLGAMRNNDILPWDYDVDIGINRDDIGRCDFLYKAKFKSHTDNKGFVWEKATEGELFKVYYSKTNRVYVNIFPFFSKNGTMTKDSWFTSHRNMEFPDHFLHPITTIEFIGRQVPSPNNIRDFLELKYGKDVIENPQYPDPHKLKFL